MSKVRPVTHSAKCGCFGLTSNGDGQTVRRGKPIPVRIASSIDTGTKFAHDSITFVEDSGK